MKNNGKLVARDYASGKLLTISWREGVITEMAPADAPPGLSRWIAPPLVDLQINGFAGIDFQQDDLTEDELLRAVDGLQQSGCTRFLLTLITDDWQRLTRRLHHLHRLRSNHPRLRQAIGGWHIEGPFLSPEPGYRGAHDPSRMLDPKPEHLTQLRSTVGSAPLLLTLAPEREGAIDCIAGAANQNIVVSLGHTNASSVVLERAVKAGATGFTHLGNACPQLLDRHDNLLWRVLDVPGLTFSLICDLHHVSPPLFRLIHRAASQGRVYYTTDAMAAAGAPAGVYSLGSLNLEVGTDGIVRQPGQTNFAGSALSPIEGVGRAARMLNCSWRQTWGGFSVRPARFMGWTSEVLPGQSADFCLIQTDRDDRITAIKTYVAGVPLESSPV